MSFRPALAGALVLFVCACGGGGGDDDDDDAGARSSATEPSHADGSNGNSTIEWEQCGDLECATLEVPLDHADPDGPAMELALARRPADATAIGSLLVNPGGPGAPGTDLVDQASSFFPEELLENFDIVGWDPRGTGQSTAIDCVDDLDPFFAADHSPDTNEELAAQLDAAQTIADGCAARSAELLPHLSSASTVADMELIRAALGEEQLTYLGFSYGTFLGALYADAHPERVRAMVLDGAVDPALGPEDLAREQAVGFDNALGAFLDDCASKGCGFGGQDPHGAFSRLMAQIEAETLPGTVDGEERVLGPGETDIGIASALYGGEPAWEFLADALNDAARGDGSLLLELSDEYTGRRTGGEYDNAQEAFFGIGCLDSPAPPVDQLDAIGDRNAAVAPVFGASTLWLSAPCSVWPVPATAVPAPITAAGAPPIVVIGTSNDPVTPMKWARSLADQLESGHLVEWRGEGHSALGEDVCIDAAVVSYLVDLTVPEPGLVC
ncbi:MAG: alpha/beta hydrolase [Acidimicrobiia bacterium]